MSEIEIITFGCRLNAYESEVMRRHAEEAGLGHAVIVNTCAVTSESVRQARQAIRKARRERPDAKIVVTGCAAQVDPAASPPWPRSTMSSAIRRRPKRDLPRARARWHRAGQGQRHHVGARDRRPPGRRLRRPGPRLCADPERLRSSLHLLHHSLRPRPVALGAGRRGRGAGAEAGRERLCRDRAHRRRHHRLWRRPSRRTHASASWCSKILKLVPELKRLGCPRSTRSKPTPR